MSILMLSAPLEPLPIYSFYLPIVFAVIASVLCEAIPFANSRKILYDHVFSSILGSIRSFLSILFAFMGKKRGAASTKIKPGIQYKYDEATGRWVPVIKHPQSIVQYKTIPKTGEQKPEITLLWPLESGFLVTQDFQQHLRTKIEKGYKYYNGGLDLAYQDVREGAPVTAAAAGILKSASFSGEGYGNVVYLDHLNGFLTTYAHLQGFGGFIPGHAVESGDVIGYLGHSGNCWGGPGNPEGTHLHFELRHQGIPIDPMPYMNQV